MILFTVCSWLCKLGEHQDCNTQECTCHCHIKEKTFCCDKFKEAVNEGVIMFFESSGRYEIDGYDVMGDYPVNFCMNCGKKVVIE